MKTVKLLLAAAFITCSALTVKAQETTETFKVSGNCGMCKSRIEKAAKEAGASTATWSEETKELTVTYKSSSTNTAKIQKKIADAGHDNAGFVATANAYKKLPGCCKYDRASQAEKKSCCTDKCEMKDGKCVSMEKCKASGCCKDEETCKANGCCGGDHAMNMNGKMDCCKDKCEKKDGKCVSMEKCKESGCCKDEETCKANGCCGGGDHAMKMNGKMDCCKDGKCSKPGHNGKDCCKKEGQ